MFPFNPISFLRSAITVDRRSTVNGRRSQGTRRLENVDALVLHQTGFTRGNSVTSYDTVGVHFVIIPDGTILQLYDETTYLHASNGFNRRSVAVEFVGNFPMQNGRWWRGGDAQNIPSERQILGGRSLVSFLQISLGITHVFAHRQATSPNRRGNCPGPHIWYNVGEWAKGRGLSDGGPNYTIGSGGPIPDKWRSNEFSLLSA